MVLVGWDRLGLWQVTGRKICTKRCCGIWRCCSTEQECSAGKSNCLAGSWEHAKSTEQSVEIVMPEKSGRTFDPAIQTAFCCIRSEENARCSRVLRCWAETIWDSENVVWRANDSFGARYQSKENEKVTYEPLTVMRWRKQLWRELPASAYDPDSGRKPGVLILESKSCRKRDLRTSGAKKNRYVITCGPEYDMTIREHLCK